VSAPIVLLQFLEAMCSSRNLLDYQAMAVDDGYDPTKPEYIIAATDAEVAEASAEISKLQSGKLERLLSSRPSGLPNEVSQHYQEVLAVMRSEEHTLFRRNSDPTGQSSSKDGFALPDCINNSTRSASGRAFSDGVLLNAKMANRPSPCGSPSPPPSPPGSPEPTVQRVPKLLGKKPLPQQIPAQSPSARRSPDSPAKMDEALFGQSVLPHMATLLGMAAPREESYRSLCEKIVRSVQKTGNGRDAFSGPLLDGL